MAGERAGVGTISIADLFTTGIIPGILLAAALVITAYVVARQRNDPAGVFPGWYGVLRAVVAAVPGIMLIAIIFGGVRSGVFTATESSCIAVLYALLVTVFVYREMDWGSFIHAVLGAVRTTAMVLLVIGTAGAFGWLMAFLQVPAATIELMQSISDNKYVILLLVLGTFMDMAPMIIICTPIFLLVIKALGIDPVQFGIILILNAGIGPNTPPVGSVLFVGCAVGKISIGEAMKTIWPFFGASIAVLLVVSYVPAVSLWLPSVFR